MDATTFTRLAAEVATLIDGIEASDVVRHVEFGEMADGSGRYYALVSTHDQVNDLEQAFRIVGPASADAPAWAAHYTDCRVELRHGDAFFAMETA